MWYKHAGHGLSRDPRTKLHHGALEAAHALEAIRSHCLITASHDFFSIARARLVLQYRTAPHVIQYAYQFSNLA